MSTYSQIYMQVVFAVRGRACLIMPSWEEKLYKYITGIVQNKGQKMLAINGVPDHIHFLIGMKPSCCLSDLVREIKKSSNEFINTNGFSQSEFHWQTGFGAFSYSELEYKNVVVYIMNQKEHHKRVKFKDEYVGLLKQFNIEFDEKYLFEWSE